LRRAAAAHSRYAAGRVPALRRRPLGIAGVETRHIRFQLAPALLRNRRFRARHYRARGAAPAEPNHTFACVPVPTSTFLCARARLERPERPVKILWLLRCAAVEQYHVYSVYVITLITFSAAPMDSPASAVLYLFPLFHHHGVGVLCAAGYHYHGAIAGCLIMVALPWWLLAFVSWLNMTARFFTYYLSIFAFA